MVECRKATTEDAEQIALVLKECYNIDTIEEGIQVFEQETKKGYNYIVAVVEDKIILELKAVSELNKIFEAQLLSYLKATGMKLEVLHNFGGKKVEYKRIVNSDLILFQQNDRCPDGMD